MKIRITTTNNGFFFGFGWDNPMSKYGRPGIYGADLILGFIVIRISWELKRHDN